MEKIVEYSKLEIFKVTPCCKSSQWSFGIGQNFEKFIVCDLCKKKHDYKSMSEVFNGYDPITYFCDKCHDSIKSNVNRSKKWQN